MDTKLKCLLLDDEIKGLSYLKMLCEQLPELEVIKAFDNPLLFLEEMPKLEFDLCIIDIEMPEMNGLQVANLLRGKPVVFATAYKQYAAEAYDLNAIDYLSKPIQLQRLQKAIEKVIRYRNANPLPQKKTFVQLNTNKGKTLLFFDKIAYIHTSETDSRDKKVHLFSGEEFLLKNISFKKLLNSLPEKEFSRINKREIIALQAIQFFSYDEITSNIPSAPGKNLNFTLSENYRKDFLEKVQF